MGGFIMKLNGIWQCEITDHGAHHHLLEGTVPGCVHTDLQKAGIIGDFYYRTNADDVQWIENCDVTYSRNFTVETPEPNTYLHFDGLVYIVHKITDARKNVYTNCIILDIMKI